MLKISQTLGANLWNPSRYRLISNCPWLDTIKRGLRLRGIGHGDRLFVYQSRDTGRPILAYWVKERPGGCCRAFVSLITLSTYVPSVAYVAARIKPAREQALAGIKALRDEEYEEKLQEAKSDDARKEWLKFMKKKDPYIHRMVEIGKIPVAFDNPELVIERLMRASANVRPKPMIMKP